MTHVLSENFKHLLPLLPLDFLIHDFLSDTVFLADSKIINVRIPGAQRSVLERIISEGPIGLVNPSKYYTECKEAGLRPCFLESFSHTIVPSQVSVLTNAYFMIYPIFWTLVLFKFTDSTKKLHSHYIIRK